jgi:CheY-like chemotaxis protein
MKFQALLVSSDGAATAALAPVLAGFSLGVESCSYSEASALLAERKFDALLVDFDEPEKAAATLQSAANGRPRSPVTAALLRDKATVRSVFGAGANFVLYKPISPEQAQASLRAATALIKRERRRALRVPVQVPVRLRAQNGPEVEGILLDVSEDGLEVLASQPLCPSAVIALKFSLPQSSGPMEVRAEVVWANPNGQSGVRFVDMSDPVRAALQAWIGDNAEGFLPEEPETVTACRLTDLSLGGCYLETQSPFPERSGVLLRLQADGMEAKAQGMVRVMHPEFGMGIEFASSTAPERDQVRQFIEFLSTRPGVTPRLSIAPLTLPAGQDSGRLQAPANGDFDDPLLDLLRNHEALSQEEFLQQLCQQRGTPAMA